MRITKDPLVRKQEILETAMQIFEEKGIQKTSMSDIANKAGVAKGLLYYYFASKEALLNEVIEDLCTGVDEKIKGIMKDDRLDFYDKFGAIISLFFYSIHENPAIMNASPGNPGVFEFIKNKLSAIAIVHALDLIELGIRKNYINIEYPEYVLRMLISGIADLYVSGVTDPKVHTTLIEQTLGMERNKIRLGAVLEGAVSR